MSKSPARKSAPHPIREELAEPVLPHVDAPTTEWFIYYRRMISYQRRELARLRLVEIAAKRVSASRSGFVVKDQAALDALDIALEVRP